jgi:Cytochrome c
VRAIGLASLGLVLIVSGCGSSGGKTADCTGASDTVGCWRDAERLPAAAVPGAKLFADAGCTSCHSYVGVGAKGTTAPDLSVVGARVHSVARYERFLVEPTPPMPSFRGLGPRRLHQLAVFLAASRGAG